MNRTVARLQLAWYWPVMISEVCRTPKTCEVCQVAKPGGNKPLSNRQQLYAGQLWKKVAIDLVGPMARKSRNKQQILVLLDHFIHWQDVIPRADTTASTVATALDAQIRCCFGLLEQIHSDQVMQFQLQLIAKLASL